MHEDWRFFSAQFFIFRNYFFWHQCKFIFLARLPAYLFFLLLGSPFPSFSIPPSLHTFPSPLNCTVAPPSPHSHLSQGRRGHRDVLSVDRTCQCAAGCIRRAARRCDACFYVIIFITRCNRHGCHGSSIATKGTHGQDGSSETCAQGRCARLCWLCRLC